MRPIVGKTMASSNDGGPKAYGGDVRELFRNPLAFSGATLGCVVTLGLLAFLVLQRSGHCAASFEDAWVQQGRAVYSEVFTDAVLAECETLDDGTCLERVRSNWSQSQAELHDVLFNLALTEACTAEVLDDAFEIDFEPGTLVKLGVEVEAPDLPEREVLVETRAPTEAVPEQAVTDDDQAAPTPEPQEDPPTEEPEEQPQPRTQPKDRDLPISKLPTDRTPFDDPPTRTVPKGDPFGDADGWSDLAKDGDAWATAVMAALNKMPVGAFGAKMDDGTAKFQITLCKDGSVKTVQKKGGSLSAVDQARVANAVRSLALPEPSDAVARQMKGRCAKIKYTFVWSNGTVR